MRLRSYQTHMKSGPCSGSPSRREGVGGWAFLLGVRVRLVSLHPSRHANATARGALGVALSASLLAGMCAAVLAAGCEQEKRVIYRNSMLGGVANAQTASPDIDLRNGETSKAAASQKTIIDNPDGTKTLLARNPKHVMNHVIYTLRQNDADLFVTQVLSKITREDFLARGVDPRQAFAILKARQEDVLALFKVIPLADQTPGVFLQSIGGGVKRLMAEDRIAVDLKWKGIDFIIERGNYKLVWFVGE
jgi:hypothetical protein